MLKKSQFLDLNNYRKLAALDKGSYGVVLQIVEKETGKIFAAKIHDMKFINKARISREIQILQSNHPSISKFIGFCPFDFENQCRPVIITQFCSNRSLKQIFELKRSNQALNGWTNTKKLINIFGIASAMSFLHSNQIMHLDLKPSNILEDDHLYPQISDFGLSQTSNENTIFNNSVPNLSVGAPVYAAPELLTGKLSTTAADVYSFSLIVYEILTDEAPYQGLKMYDILNKVVQQGYRPDINKESMPNCYKELISNCWSQDPKARPTFNEIVHLLKDNLEFITDFDIDESEYFSYVEFIDDFFKKSKTKGQFFTYKKVCLFPFLKSKPLSLSIQTIDLTNYQRLDRIGEGSFSVVYEIVKKENGQKFAAKILKKEFFEGFEDDDESVNLRREVTILQKLNHPSIVKYIGYSPLSFDKSASPVIVTELASNCSLEEILNLDRKSLANEFWNDTKKLIIIYGIAASMSYLHSQNILHRNLKPSNILIDELIHPKLADFGLAKNINENDDRNKRKDETPILGTYIYDAPEVFSNLEYSKATDVYSFALVVYEIMTNKKPSFGSTMYQVMTNVLNGYRPDLSQLPECYRKLIENCWSTDPKKRPTFESIVTLLKTDENFISKSIKKDEFFDYVNNIDKLQTNFKSEQVIKVIDFNSIYTSENEANFVDLANYQKKREVSNDDYSTKYEIVDKKAGKIYSAKESNIEINNVTKEESSCLSKEVSILSQLNHPSLLHFIGYSSINLERIQKPTIVTEYASNKSLQDFIDIERNGLFIEGWNETKKLINIYGIASCMSYLHSHEILHRNLKPKSVILDNLYHPKLTDFGFCYQIQIQKCLQNQTIFGTNESPIYTTTELIANNNETKASDVYSFSFIVFELITGEKPFDGYSKSFQILNDVLTNSKRPVIKETVPDCYRELIEACWRPNPNERPTFDQIVNFLRTDSRFLSMNVNRDEYFDFINFKSSNSEIELLMKAAEKNDPVALFNLGLIYQKGDGIQADKQKALQFYERSSSLGNAQAQFNLGLMYSKGDGVSVDKEKAVSLFEKAASQGYSRAQSNLGVMYCKGEGVQQNYQKAVHFFELASSQGDSEAQVNLGLMYDQGEGVQVDKRRAFDLYNKSANQGNLIALFNLGLMYQKGLDGFIQKDTKKAALLFQQAADKGLAQAQFNLGVLYSKGSDDFPMNEEKARQLFEMAANQGYPDAQLNLALLYSNDNKAKMVELLMKAAEKNNAKAQFQLGVLYSKGTVVKKDSKKAVEYYTKAANQNYKQAIFNLGVLYFKGADGVPQDKKRAAELFEQICNDHSKALFNLAIMYMNGDGVPKDTKKSIQYFERAADLGSIDALLNLGLIYNEGSFGVVPDQPKSIQYYKRAADSGNSKAQFKLGLMYQKGIGCQIDKPKAKFYYKLASDQRNDQAQLNLALLLFEGNISEQNEALKYLMESANHGNPEAMFYLARKYQQKNDMEKAIKYFTLSANKRFPNAQCELGKIYLNGEGVEKDIQKAEALLQEAASHNVNEALIYLSEIRKNKGNSSELVYECLNSKIQAVHLKMNDTEPYTNFITALSNIQVILIDRDLSQFIAASSSVNKSLKDFNKEASLILSSTESKSASASLPPLNNRLPNQSSNSPSSPRQTLQYPNSPLLSSQYPISPRQSSPRIPSPYPNSARQNSSYQTSPYPNSARQTSPYPNSPRQNSSYQNSPLQNSPRLSSPYPNSARQNSSYQNSPRLSSPIQNSARQNSPYPYLPLQNSPRQTSPYPNSARQTSPFQNFAQTAENDYIDEISKLQVEIQGLESRLIQMNKQIDSSPRELLDSEASSMSTSSTLLPEPAKIQVLVERADEGNAKAQLHLASCYATGKGVEMSSSKALQYYLMAASQGNMNAQYAAGSYYYYGKGTKENKRKAFELFSKAAKQGHMKAQFALGHFYQYDKDKNQRNYKKAAEWYRKAATQGHEVAIKILQTDFGEKL